MSICTEFADECPDRDVTTPWHSPGFSLLGHSDGKLPAFHRTDKIAPCHGLTGSWKLPTALGGDSSTLFPWVGEGWGPHEFWHQLLQFTGHVTMGRMLVVTPVTVELVTWLAQDGCLLVVRETWDRQSWHELGRPWAEGKGLPMVTEGGCSVCWFSCLWQPQPWTETQPDHSGSLWSPPSFTTQLDSGATCTRTSK